MPDYEEIGKRLCDDRQICVTIAHIALYKKIVEQNIDICLILEDDAILCPGFRNGLTRYLRELPSDFDMAFLNAGCGLHIDRHKIKPDTIWYKHPFSRTCCSYIITKRCCEKILETIIPFYFPIDFELNVQIRMHNLNVYWAEPPIVSDGSESKYTSTSSDKTKSLFSICNESVR
jgi:glycosyl transferase family 25